MHTGQAGAVRAESVEKDQLKAKGLKDLVCKYVDTVSTTLITDEYRGYMTMNRIIEHMQVNHQKECEQR